MKTLHSINSTKRTLCCLTLAAAGALVALSTCAMLQGNIGVPVEAAGVDSQSIPPPILQPR